MTPSEGGRKKQLRRYASRTEADRHGTQCARVSSGASAHCRCLWGTGRVAGWLVGSRTDRSWWGEKPSATMPGGGTVAIRGRGLESGSGSGPCGRSSCPIGSSEDGSDPPPRRSWVATIDTAQHAPAVCHDLESALGRLDSGSSPRMDRAIHPQPRAN